MKCRQRSPNSFPAYFDKILVDAPCSGEGMFRKIRKRHASGVKKNRRNVPKSERDRKTGDLHAETGRHDDLFDLYFSPEENEQIIAWVLREFPEIQLIPMKGYEGFSEGRPDLADGNPELKKCVRIWPHRMKGEGHFLALLKKKGESSRLKERQTEKAKMPQELFDFLQTVKKPLALDRLEIRQEKVFVHPDCRRDLKGLRIMRSGLLLGECLKNRFEPSQALAMALRADEYPNVLYLSREDDRVIRYLKGETIDLRDEESVEKGWVLICVDNYPLGFGKAAGGSVKNKYLAGWRWM